MLRDALDWLGQTVQNSHSAKVLDLGDPRTAHVVIGGNIKEFCRQPALRSHTVSTVEDLSAAAERWGSDGTIWIAKDAVRLVTNDADRRDVVTLPLVKSPQYMTLETLAATPRHSQQELIRRLRVDLPGTLRRAELLSVVRKIRFRQSSAGDADVQHGKESLGRAIEAQVTGSGDIPETIVVFGPVFCNHGEREMSYQVSLDLEILPGEEVFVLRPLPDELNRALTDALQSIRERLDESLGTNTGIFYGTP